MHYLYIAKRPPQSGIVIINAKSASGIGGKAAVAIHAAHVSKVTISASCDFKPNDSYADKLPFTKCSTVQPATCLPSSLCAIKFATAAHFPPFVETTWNIKASSASPLGVFNCESVVKVHALDESSHLRQFRRINSTDIEVIF